MAQPQHQSDLPKESTVQQINRIELRLRNLNQLFNSLDPSPFYEQDLDTDAEEFMIGWARELPRSHPFEIVLHLSEPRTDGLTHAEAEDRIGAAVSLHFRNRERQENRRLIDLLRTGRTSLFIGMIFLALCVFCANLVEIFEDQNSPIWHILREGLVIIGWVAMWRPVEIFLYDWWPIAGARQLFEKLGIANFSLVEEPCPQETRP
jgi:hypothetical protein